MSRMKPGWLQKSNRPCNTEQSSQHTLLYAVIQYVRHVLDSAYCLRQICSMGRGRQKLSEIAQLASNMLLLSMRCCSQCDSPDWPRHPGQSLAGCKSPTHPAKQNQSHQQTLLCRIQFTTCWCWTCCCLLIYMVDALHITLCTLRRRLLRHGGQLSRGCTDRFMWPCLLRQFRFVYMSRMKPSWLHKSNKPINPAKQHH